MSTMLSSLKLRWRWGVLDQADRCWFAGQVKLDSVCMLACAAPLAGLRQLLPSHWLWPLGCVM